MRILGIDPGFAITGYSIIDYIGNKFKLIASGAIKILKEMKYKIFIGEMVSVEEKCIEI